jgi:hypothetical protein
MTSNGKTLNYKVVDLVESYNFDIKFTSIRVQTKKLQIFEKDSTPIAMAHSGSWCYSTARHPPQRMYSFAIFFRTIYFCKKRKENCKKKKKIRRSVTRNNVGLHILKPNLAHHS